MSRKDFNKKMVRLGSLARFCKSVSGGKDAQIDISSKGFNEDIVGLGRPAQVVEIHHLCLE